MLAFTISKSAVALCRPAQLGVGRGGREMVGRLWRRLASGEVRTVRAVPVEGSGLRARFGGEFSPLQIHNLSHCCNLLYMPQCSHATQ